MSDVFLPADSAQHTFETFAVVASAPPIAGQPVGSGGQMQQSGQPLGPNGQPQGPAPGLFGGPVMLFVLVAFFGLMIMTSMMSARKEKRRRQEMFDSLARHDRVQTSGGIIGTIAEIRDDEIVLKVDESTNARIHFNRSAIQAVLKKAGGPRSSSDVSEAAQEPVGAAS